ncbi:MAG: hypothetical protein ACREQY_02820, partial [Candidatus Binatia bacterium]
ESPAATRASTKRLSAPRPEAPAEAPPPAKGEDPSFWRGVGKGFGSGFRELGHGFKRFGENVGDAFRREEGEK